MKGRDLSRDAEPTSDGVRAQARETVRSRPSGVVFDLGSLGWKAFQDLCGTVLGTVLSQTVVAFRPTRDEGRDFAFEGLWHPTTGEALEGKLVVQAKFKANGNFHRSDLASELPKIRRLVASRRCGSYVLMTNAGVTSPAAAQIESDLIGCGVRHSMLIGADQLDRYLRESPRLRALVPRLYGLGDLSQILDERQYDQATALLASMREDIEKFVITAPYNRAIDAMLQHGFVLLVGAPAAGKSMIAAALTAGSIDMWGSRPIKCENAAAFSSSWNPHEPDQLFWIDDAFGAAQYERQRADEWNQLLTKLKAASSLGARIIMTSRDYIWNEARDDIKLSVFPLLESGQVVVDVHELVLEDKRQILYNHLKYGSQPLEFRRLAKPFLPAACEVTPFLPEVARRFGDPQLTGSLIPSALSVLAFFERPVEHLGEVVGSLGEDEFAALVVLYMSEGTKASPIALNPDEAEAIARLGSSLGGVVGALGAMRGSLVVLSPSPSRILQWSFKHPTIGEAIQRYVIARPELLSIYLVGCPLESLLAEITCGDVRLARAFVVREPYFEVVARRIREAPPDLEIQSRISAFVVNRCSQTFVRKFGSSLGQLRLDPSRPGSLRVGAKLERLGLLSEVSRKAIVAHSRDQAIDWIDPGILQDEDFLELATEGETQAAMEALHESVSDIDSVLQAVEDDYDGSEDPDDVVARLSSGLDALKSAFPNDESIARAVKSAGDMVDVLGDSLREKWGREPDGDFDDWRDRGLPTISPEGNIFDDVDE